jgi:3-dehydroquinate dehydratase
MICIPIRKKTVEELTKDLKKAEKIADVIEIWFAVGKNFTDKDVKKIFKISRKPIIYKPTNFPPLPLSFSHISKFLKHNPEFIDLDVETNQKTISQIKKSFPKVKIILSHHNFKETPPTKTLKKIIKKMAKKGADIFKIATYAKSLQDSLRMLELLSEQSKKKKMICICMGKNGEITRTAGHLFGNYLMYAPLDLKDKTADGQITAKHLKEIQTVIPKICR